MSDEMNRLSTPDSRGDVATSGLTRAGLLRLLGASAAAASGLELLATPGAMAADTQKAAAHRKDLTVLQYALSLEYLGFGFYQTALHTANLTGDAHTAALAFRAHERSHVQFVQSRIRKFGGTPHPTEKFDFGSSMANQTAFLKTSAQLEELCVETLNGAAAIVSTETLAALATIISVEARQAAWVRAILARNPAPAAMTPPLTAAASKSAFNKLHLTTEKFR
jgi:hypothetical protein